MNALEIVRAVQEHGATLSRENGHLVVTGEPLPEALRAELSQHKAELLVALGCPFDETIGSILVELRSYLLPSLRSLPDEKLLALVNWHIIAAWEKAVNCAAAKGRKSHRPSRPSPSNGR